MDWNRLIQGMGGRLLRQAIGILMKKGIDSIGTPPPKGRPMTEDDRRKQAQSAETQKRVNQIMRLGRRFWR